MDQTVYLLEDSFFKSGYEVFEDIAKKMSETTNSEKISLIYDPICFSFFKEAFKFNDELFQKSLINIFGQFEEMGDSSLSWHSLDDKSTHIIEMVGELMFKLEYRTRHIDAYGCIPIRYYKHRGYLFFRVSPYIDSSDKFYLIPEAKYKKIVGETIDLFFNKTPSFRGGDK